MRGRAGEPGQRRVGAVAVKDHSRIHLINADTRHEDQVSARRCKFLEALLEQP